MSEPRAWLSEEQAAEWLGVPVAAIRQAVEAGQLPALVIGDHVRISRDAWLAEGHQRRSSVAAGTSEATAAIVAPDHGVPAPPGVTWLQEPTERDPYPYYWPKQTEPENYDPAWQATISLPGEDKDVKVVVGQTSGYRVRMTVFFNGVPVCEFAKTRDGARWASVIKPNGKKVLPAGWITPKLYRHADVQPYRDATGMTGSGVPKAAAVVIDDGDLHSAVHHAAARWLGRRGFPIDPGTEVRI